ncbi:MAG: M20/M25/M40 family metallo-hydrolase [Candidatus Pacebacteria bacterium]|nr:M20/M25/M40 family metallo-hydrolase [Candidatus Paceibacterota bacterium]
MNLIDLFQQLVQIDSPTGKEENISNFVSNFIKEECNLTPLTDTHNNVFVKVKGVGEPIFFNAHLDTVQPGENIVPIIENGIIKSQGNTILGADNKASVAAILSSLKDLNTNNLEHRPLEILFTISEESENLGAINFDKSMIKSKIGYIFDLNRPVGTIVKSAPFYARFSIKINGKSAHASRRDLSIPAMDSLVEIINLIEKVRKKELIINIGEINGGTARNTVIGTISIEGEFRSVNKIIFYKTKELLEKKLSDINDKTKSQISFEIIVENPGYLHTDAEINYVKTTIEKILNKKIDVIETMGCSDGNIFNNEIGLTTFDLGDGGEGAHTTDESISISNLSLLKKLVTNLMIT